MKKIVEGQGGRAWVESQPGQGATFRFLWPKVPIVPVVSAVEPRSFEDFNYPGDPLDHQGRIAMITPPASALLESL